MAEPSARRTWSGCAGVEGGEGGAVEGAEVGLDVGGAEG